MPVMTGVMLIIVGTALRALQPARATLRSACEGRPKTADKGVVHSFMIEKARRPRDRLDRFATALQMLLGHFDTHAMAFGAVAPVPAMMPRKMKVWVKCDAGTPAC
jgi:hypothetical protein